jgi:hypothetical protein
VRRATLQRNWTIVLASWLTDSNADVGDFFTSSDRRVDRLSVAVDVMKIGLQKCRGKGYESVMPDRVRWLRLIDVKGVRVISKFDWRL